MKGFAGLDEFATDVDAAIAAADMIAAAPKPAPDRPSPAPLEHNDVQGFGESAFGRGIKTIGGWVLGIGLLLLVNFAIRGGFRAATSEEPSNYPESSTYDSSASQANADSSSVEMPADSALPYASESSSDEELYGNDTSSNVDAVDAIDDETLRPAAGTDVLTRGELRWCLEEAERIKGEKSEMERIQYTDTERFNDNVDGFNSRAQGLRSACNGQYRVSDQTAIEQEISLRRYSLQSEGSRRVQQ